MIDASVLVAVIAAAASVVNTWILTRHGQKITNIDRAVNGVPAGAPSLRAIAGQIERKADLAAVVATQTAATATDTAVAVRARLESDAAGVRRRLESAGVPGGRRSSDPPPAP